MEHYRHVYRLSIHTSQSDKIDAQIALAIPFSLRDFVTIRADLVGVTSFLFLNRRPIRLLPQPLIHCLLSSRDLVICLQLQHRY